MSFIICTLHQIYGSQSVGEIINAYKILIRKPEGKDHLGNLDIAGRIILK
jgi:hypothetical protein